MKLIENLLWLRLIHEGMKFLFPSV